MSNHPLPGPRRQRWQDAGAPGRGAQLPAAGRHPHRVPAIISHGDDLTDTP